MTSWTEDFESYTVGTVPASWTVYDNSSTGVAEVDNTRANDGSKSFRTDQNNTGSPSHWEVETADYSPDGNHKITFYVNVNGKQNSGGADRFSFANTPGGNGPSSYSWRVNFVEDSDGTNGRGIYARDGDGAGGSSPVFLANIVYDVWWRCEVTVFYDTDTYDITVEDLTNGTTATLTGLGFQTNGTAADYPYYWHINDNYDGWFDTITAEALAASSSVTPTNAVASPKGGSVFSESFGNGGITLSMASPLSALNGVTVGALLQSASASSETVSPLTTSDVAVSTQSAVASSLSVSPFTGAQSTDNITAASGASLQAFYTNSQWLIDDAPAGEVTEERRKWDSLKLTLRVGRETLDNVLRPMDNRSGEMEVLVDSEGALRAYDRAGGGNSYVLTPPYTRSVTPANPTGPWERRATFHVKKYTEKAVDQHGQRYDVTLELVPAKSREPDAEDDADGAPATGEWEFAFSSGRVATKRVRREVEDKSERGTTGTELKLILEPAQAKVLTESASYQGAVNTREVPDGENLTEDNSTERRNSVYVVPPTNGERYLPGGNYRVDGWEVEWQNDAFYLVNLTLKPVGDTAKRTRAVAEGLTATVTTT